MSELSQGEAMVDRGTGTEAQPTRTVDRSHARELFQRLTSTRDPAIREELVGIHLPLVEYLARRFRNRGEPLEDLVQVGTIGLLKAIDRLCRTRRTTRSALIRAALETELDREAVRAEEVRQRIGYERHPVEAGEFDVWFDEQDWVER